MKSNCWKKMLLILHSSQIAYSFTPSTIYIPQPWVMYMSSRSNPYIWFQWPVCIARIAERLVRTHVSACTF
ncbi:uncharacterized protein HD556DRAFT_1319598 [Suillus plorans]|uniref:Secreted protein n=1 Tax=Suillus plorans TaxID=116603 RepID=A0A9P7JA23_9AGAM|nr:uncharacterized protein HD556DRAFT_1319598 [Suillus plorans]KAG1810350.1 hypothetical protein HD556DRAFT_1319598 [Suillus plorans]